MRTYAVRYYGAVAVFCKCVCVCEYTRVRGGTGGRPADGTSCTPPSPAATSVERVADIYYIPSPPPADKRRVGFFFRFPSVWFLSRALFFTLGRFINFFTNRNVYRHKTGRGPIDRAFRYYQRHSAHFNDWASLWSSLGVNGPSIDFMKNDYYFYFINIFILLMSNL